MAAKTKNICPETNTEAPSLESCLERSKFRDNLECRKCLRLAKYFAENPKPGSQAQVSPVLKKEKEVTALGRMIQKSPAHPESVTTQRRLKPAATIPSSRICNYEGCGKKLQKHNSTGFCRRHASCAQKYKPAPVPCKTPDCKNMTKGYGKTGLCHSCSSKKAREKARLPASQKKKRATWAKNKKTLKAAKSAAGSPRGHRTEAEAPDNNSGSTPPPDAVQCQKTKRENRYQKDMCPKSNLLAEKVLCNIVIKQATLLSECSGCPGPVGIDEEQANLILAANNAPVPDSNNHTSLTLDFSEHPELLKALRAEAKEEFRDAHQQVMFILNHHLKGYFKNMPQSEIHNPQSATKEGLSCVA